MRRMARTEDDQYVGGEPVLEIGIGGGGGSQLAANRAQAARVEPQGQLGAQSFIGSPLPTQEKTDSIIKNTVAVSNDADARVKYAKEHNAPAKRFKKGGMVGCRDYGK